jgi:hypothetical protein
MDIWVGLGWVSGGWGLFGDGGESYVSQETRKGYNL